MMDCSQVRDAFIAGRALSKAEAQAHLDACPECAALFENDAELGHALAAQIPADRGFPDELFGAIEARVERETGLRAWLRSRPSGLRFQLIALSVILVVLVAGGMLHRPDFAAYPVLRLVILLGSYFIAVLLAVGKELTFPARSGKLLDYAPLVLFGLGLPFLAAFAPATEQSRQAGPEGALGCFLYGALFTLPVGILLWAFDRDDRPTLRTICLSAAALGLSANLVLELHCPSGHPLHLLLGHASLGLAWLASWFVTRRLSRA
jgi:ABC-type transport system involved in cytochrome c biogenesis permease component